MIDRSEKVTIGNLKDQMQALAQEKALFIEQEFKSYIDFIQIFRDVEYLILGHSSLSGPPIKTSEPVWSDFIPSEYLTLINGKYNTFETGVFYSRFNTISEDGTDLTIKNTPLDKLFPLMYRENFEQIYTGFGIDEIFH